MRNNLLVLVFLVPQFLLFNEHNDVSGLIRQHKIIDTVIKDIPVNKEGRPGYFYLRKLDIEPLFGFNPLENGYDSLQIRIWFEYAYKDSGQLVTLTRSNNDWNAGWYDFAYLCSEDRKTITGVDDQVLWIKPISGWDNFSKKLFQAGITTLPDMCKIENYPSIADGDEIIIEVATAGSYRIYSYRSPEVAAMNNIKEAKSVMTILRLLEQDFRFEFLRKPVMKKEQPKKNMVRPTVRHRTGG